MSTSNFESEKKPIMSHETYHPLYVIYSRWSFREIYGLLSTYTGSPSENIGTLKVDYNFEGHDTNRTFVLLSDNVVNGLKKDEFDKPNRRGFSFSKYRVKDDFVVPNRALCVPIPKNLGMSGSEVASAIKEKLTEATFFRVLSPTDFTVTVPLQSREADTPKGAAYLGFAETVDTETITVVRALLHNTLWNDSTDESDDTTGETKLVFNCHYAQTTARPKGQDGTGNWDRKDRKDGTGKWQDRKDGKPKTFYKHEQK